MSKRLNLHAELKRGSFDFAFLTTYEFDAPFFEGFALEKFDSLASNGGIVVFTDDSTHDEMLSGSSGRAPKLAGLRYVVCPVRCQAGVFHPKVFLFASSTRGLLVVGSANLTRAGLGRNAELVTALRFEAGKREEHLALFRDAFRFFEALTHKSPSPTLLETYRELRARCPWLASESEDAPRSVRLAHNLDTPIWDQLVEALASEPETVNVLSPYFDADPQILDRIAPEHGASQVVILTERGGTTMTQRWLEHPRVVSGDVRVFVSDYGDGERPQRLHGKALLLRCGARGVLTFGSANFTQAALLRSAHDGNVEANLVIGEVGDLSAETLFDPLERRRAAKIDDLRERGERSHPTRSSADLRVLEVRLEDSGLVAIVEHALEDESPAAARVTLEGRKPVTVALEPKDERSLVGPVNDEVRRAVTEASATVQIVIDAGGSDPLLSNRVFLLNLQDPPTGGRRQQDRRQREAKQSAAQFADVLAELLNGDDDEALRRFLELCDINIAQAARINPGRGPREAWEPGGTRVLGARNVRLFFTIHEAALGFIDRHLRRLSRHTSRASLSSIPAVLHVARAIAEVARAQLDRLATGIEAVRSLGADDWGRCRTQGGQYVTRLEECVRILHEDYFPALREAGWEPEIPDVLEPELPPLLTVVSGAFSFKDRLDAAKLRVRTEYGAVPADYFPRDVLHPDSFSATREDVRRRISSLS